MQPAGDQRGDATGPSCSRPMTLGATLTTSPKVGACTIWPLPTYMPDVADRAVEEHQVAGPQLGARDRRADLRLHGAGVRQVDAGGRVGVQHEPRAVERAGPRGRPRRRACPAAPGRCRRRSARRSCSATTEVETGSRGCGSSRLARSSCGGGGDGGLPLLGGERVVERPVLGDLVLERLLLGRDLVEGPLRRARGLLGRRLRLGGGDVGGGGRVEQLVLVPGDHLQHAHPVDELVGRVAGHHRREGVDVSPVYALRAMPRTAFWLRASSACAGSSVPSRPSRRGLLGRQLLARGVELLGHRLELVPLGGDQVRGLGGGRRLLGSGRAPARWPAGRRRRRRGPRGPADGAAGGSRLRRTP